MNRSTRLPAIAGAAALLCALLSPASVAVAAPETASSAEPAAVDLVDDEATAETRSLFAYLRDIRGEGILFGHQHTTDYGVTFDARDGVSSDVKAATGDYPAVFGFDTLIIEGRERPGDPAATRDENALRLAQSFVEADAQGGIVTLSAHIENFATGGDFYDTSGDALRAVLPGGSKHADLTAYLDDIALAARSAVNASGALVPVIFRPWHENAGSWFWWGAAFGTPGEYAELYRFTVEYLRDVKDVHNLLYAFSPGGGFGGDEQLYLRTYPGDDFIDVLGYDTYDEAASPAFLTGLTDDLAMLARLADARGKVSAFTEFGITGGIRPDGQNANPEWYTDVLAAITADPDAARTTYMMTWANFGGTTTPYTPTSGETLPHFLAYYDDPYTLFASDLSGVHDRVTTAVPERPTAHLASPADGARVPGESVTLRASVRGFDEADRVDVTVAGTDESIDLTAPQNGGLWWTGEWTIPADLRDNSTRELTVHVSAAGRELASTASAVILGERPVLAPGVVDDFEGYGDDSALRSEFVQYGANTMSLQRAADGAVGGGEKALRLDYSFATQSYTGIGRQLTADWSAFEEFQAWVDPDASGNKLVLQIAAGGIAFEAYPSLVGDEPSLVTIPFADWRPAPWDTAHADARLTPELRAQITQFNIYVNAADGGATSGSLVLDELRAVPGTPPPLLYADVPRDHADHDAIVWLHDEVVDLGDRNGRFHPDRALKQDEAAAVFAGYDADAVAPAGAKRLAVVEALWRLAGSPAPTAAHAFPDVPDRSADAVAWAVEEGVVEPESAEAFGATDRVKRAEIARWLQRTDAFIAASAGVVLADFESGAQGWDIASWQQEGTATATDGHLLVEAAAGGNWLTGPAADLSGRTALLLDVTASTGAAPKAALQLGPDWTWCETTAAPRSEGAATIVIDLSSLSAACVELLGDVRGINVFLDEGTHEIDAIRAR
ncbi:glycosyl hydrolase [Microbacterium sp.]|uniref:glycosyl hydrolase n=1 Tax=Microbacterium sp. TaxID=51671 RepID=UPI00281202F0|nr:glycosyl hydrolase [Microbacterium sp.]